jgi:hypothetical protein
MVVPILHHISHRANIFDPISTHSIQAPPTQHSLRRRTSIPAIPLQIPCNISSAHLREHLRYLVDLRGVYS